MKAISLIQPWASLVAFGQKTIETRSWPTPYRGPLAIHASKGFPRDCQALCWESPFEEALSGANPDLPLGFDVPLGCIVATAELFDCMPVPANLVNLDAYSGCKFERHFGDYSRGRYMWRLRNVKALDKPIPAKGSLGLWEWNS